MTVLALVLTRAAGAGRAALVTVCAALVTALLLVDVALLRLPERPREGLFDVVSDPGTRGGTALAVALLTLPLLLLLHQAVRLGTSARERRLAGLRLAGATPADVRRIGAVEVGVPALLGALLGLPLYDALRLLLGGVDLERTPDADVGSVLHLVPTTVGPTWWQAALVVAGVTVLGVLVGSQSSSGLRASPLGVIRRQPTGPPRPWAAVLLLVAAGLTGLAYGVASSGAGPPTAAVFAIAAVTSAVLGMLGLASWSAYHAGRIAERRASTAPVLLAARRLVADPRPAGRAAAAVGGIGLVSGGAAGILAEVTGGGETDRFYLTSLTLVAAALLAALLVVVMSLAVHSAETLLDQKRSMAALVAQGASPTDLSRSQRWELLLTALPVAVGGVVLGSVVTGAAAGVAGPSALVLPLNVVLTPALVVLATLLATALTRPLVHRAASPEHLRTE